MTIAEGAGMCRELPAAEACVRLFELLPDPALVADFNGILRHVNAPAAELLGLPASELCGMPLVLFVHPEEHAALAGRLRLLAGGVEVQCELGLAPPGGAARQLHWRAAPMKGGFVAFGRELSADDAPPPRPLPETTGEGVGVWDLTAGRVYASDQAYALFGLAPPAERPDPETLLAALHPEDAPTVHRQVKALLEDPAGDRGQLEFRVVRSDRTLRLKARLCVHRDADGRPTRLFGAARDAEGASGGCDLTEALFGNPAGLMVVLDAEGRVVRFNPAAERATGYRAAEVIGSSFWGLFFPGQEAEAMRRLLSIPDSDLVQELFTTEWLTRDGRRVPVTWSHTVVRDEEGRPAYIVCLGFEVGELRQARRRLLEMEENYRRLVELSFDLVVVESEGRIVDINPRGAAMLGGGIADYTGQPIAELFTADCGGWPGVVSESYGAVPPLECRLRARNGRELDVEGIAIPIRWRGRPGTQAVFRDITPRKEAERALREREEERRRHREHLEESVARRTGELQAVNRELEAFTYSVTHDLRAPLRAINGFGQALEEEYAGRLDEQGAYYLRRIRSNSKLMGDLIDDLLELSRVNQYELQRETVDLAELARAVVADLRVAEPGRRVEFVCPQSLPAEGDPRLLRVLLRNLVENAWKYTGNEPLARICIEVRDEEEGRVWSVADNGIGFNPKLADGLFRAFHRLDTAKRFEGTGIGLATVQRIIHRHGGRVWASAEEGRGATFFFTL